MRFRKWLPQNLIWWGIPCKLGKLDTVQHSISLRWYVSECMAWIINNTLWYSTGTGGTTTYHRIPTSIPFHWDDMWVSSRPGSSTTHCDTVQEQEGPQHITGYRPASHFIEMICERVQGLDHQQHTVIQYRNRKDHNISQDTDQHPISLRWYVSEFKAWIINNTLWYSTGTEWTTTYHRIPTSIPFHWDDMWASSRPGSSTTHCDTVQEQERPQHIVGCNILWSFSVVVFKTDSPYPLVRDTHGMQNLEVKDLIHLQILLWSLSDWIYFMNHDNVFLFSIIIIH